MTHRSGVISGRAVARSLVAVVVAAGSAAAAQSAAAETYYGGWAKGSTAKTNKWGESTQAILVKASLDNSGGTVQVSGATNDNCGTIWQVKFKPKVTVDASGQRFHYSGSANPTADHHNYFGKPKLTIEFDRTAGSPIVTGTVHRVGTLKAESGSGKAIKCNSTQVVQMRMPANPAAKPAPATPVALNELLYGKATSSNGQVGATLMVPRGDGKFDLLWQGTHKCPSSKEFAADERIRKVGFNASRSINGTVVNNWKLHSFASGYPIRDAGTIAVSADANAHLTGSVSHKTTITLGKQKITCKSLKANLVADPLHSLLD